MKQSRVESLVEQLFSVAIGFIVAIVSQLIIFPMVGIHVGIGTNLVIVC